MVGGEVTAEGEAQEAPMSTMRIETLDNGLVVLLQEQHTVPVATFWVWYRVGSRNEIPGLTGISHWVEHMLFKGTPTHPKGMLTRHIDRLGGRWNAFTWKDYTAYHEVLPAEHLGVAIRLEADRMANTIMEPSEVESERTVIISEREGSRSRRENAGSCCAGPAGRPHTCTSPFTCPPHRTRIWRRCWSPTACSLVSRVSCRLTRVGEGAVRVCTALWWMAGWPATPVLC